MGANTEAPSTEKIKAIIKSELPLLIQNDPEVKAFIVKLVEKKSADKILLIDRRIEQVLEELKRDREEQRRKWDDARQEDKRKWDDARQEDKRKWDDAKQEDKRKWDDAKQEDKRKWDDANREFVRIHEEIMAVAKKHDRAVGALGARWGMQSETAFRNALAGILEESFGVQVIHVNEFDAKGEVFGRPDQVELDVIIKNGLLIICEIKSSMDKAGMYIFERKVRFYEKLHQLTASRMIVISPMIDKKARKVGEALGIEMYHDSIDIEKI